MGFTYSKLMGHSGLAFNDSQGSWVVEHTHFLGSSFGLAPFTINRLVHSPHGADLAIARWTDVAARWQYNPTYCWAEAAQVGVPRDKASRPPCSTKGSSICTFMGWSPSALGPLRLARTVQSKLNTESVMDGRHRSCRERITRRNPDSRKSRG